MKPHLNYSIIKKKPRVIEPLPWIGKNTATTLYPYIWMPEKSYKDIHSSAPHPLTIALILHEQEHLKRMKEQGVMKWYMRYVLSPMFRFNEELEATRSQFAYMKAAGLTFDIERKARLLSSWLYFWPASYDYALERLKELWQSS